MPTCNSRLTKEKNSYEKEVVKEEERLEKKKRDGLDEADLRKQVKIFCVLYKSFDVSWLLKILP